MSNYYQWLAQSLIRPVERTAGVSSRHQQWCQLNITKKSHICQLLIIAMHCWSCFDQQVVLLNPGLLPTPTMIAKFCFQFVFLLNLRRVRVARSVGSLLMSAQEHIALKPLSSFTRGKKIIAFSFQWKGKQCDNTWSRLIYYQSIQIELRWLQAFHHPPLRN